MIQPFGIIEGLSSMTYTAFFVSDSSKKQIEDRNRYNVLVELDPWGKLVEFKCECDGNKYSKGKKLCKHISNDNIDNPGILQILKQWGEIQNIPSIENE